VVTPLVAIAAAVLVPILVITAVADKVHNGPHLACSKAEATIGETVVVSGRGYNAGEQVYLGLGSDGVEMKTILATPTAAPDGSFSVQQIVPDPGSHSGDGGYTLTARGAISGKTAHTTIYIPAPETQATPTASPHLSASRAEAPVGDTVTLSGSGYAPGEKIYISLNWHGLGAIGQSWTTTAGPDGSFTNLAVQIPNPGTMPRDDQFTAKGSISGRTANTPFTIAP
jgi:hypothetical protein